MSIEDTFSEGKKKLTWEDKLFGEAQRPPLRTTLARLAVKGIDFLLVPSSYIRHIRKRSNWQSEVEGPIRTSLVYTVASGLELARLGWYIHKISEYMS